MNVKTNNVTKMKNTYSKVLNYGGKWKSLIWFSVPLAMLSAVAGTLPYIYIHNIISNVLQKPINSAYIWYNVWLILGFSVLSIVLYFAAMILSHLLTFRIESGIRYQLMQHLFKLPLGYFKLEPSGKLRKTIDDNATLTHNIIAHNTPDLATVIVFPLIMLVAFFMYDWRMGLIALATLLASMFSILPMYSGKNKKCVADYLDAQEQMNAAAVEFVRGIPVVKIFQQTIYVFKAFRKSVKNYAEFSLNYAFMARKWMLLSSLLSNGTIYVLLPAAIIWISRGQNVVNIVVNLLFYILFATYSSMQLAKLMLSAESVFQADLVMSKLDEIMSVKPLEYGVQSTRTKYDVKFENISFTYPTAESEAVENISFEIKQGQRVALVGESGGGKSTLAQLLPRFYEPDQGKITIDGVNIKEFSQEALMEQISFIFQNQTLFKISVLDNLLQAKPDATENEILTACAKAQCLDVVQNLPQGLNTVVGGQGVFLSGGEQQRILIAKAFLKDAPIIVLDEATAFTDPENEHLILKAFRELMENKTVLMIAHRLNSIIDCDQILVVERGEIVEQGKHQELIDLDATYAAMWSDYQLASDWRLNY